MSIPRGWKFERIDDRGILVHDSCMSTPIEVSIGASDRRVRSFYNLIVDLMQADEFRSSAVGAQPREVRHTIKQAGAVVCNGAVTRYESPSCIVLEMDLQSKYCELDASCGHGVFLAATERSLHLDDSRPRDDMTWVEFELPAGNWSFVSGSVSRYTLTCMFLRDADSNVPVQGSEA